MTGELYHGTSHAGALLIVSEDRMLSNEGISFTRNFEKAKVFAARAVGNAMEYGYSSDPDAVDLSDPIMLACVAERQTSGDEGVILVFDRASLERQIALRKIEPDPSWDWGMGFADNDEEEERIETDDDFVPDMLRHIKRIVILSPDRYAAFKAFVLRHDASCAKAFQQIERLAR